MADTEQSFLIAAPNGHTYRFTGTRPPTPDEIAAVAAADTPKPPAPSIGAQVLRGATSALPVVGGIGGGIVGAPAGGVGGIVGVGGGAMLGETLRQLINHYALGDRINNAAPYVQGATNAAGAAAMTALPAITNVVSRALSPSGVLTDLEKSYARNPGFFNGMASRAAGAVRSELSQAGAPKITPTAASGATVVKTGLTPEEQAIVDMAERRQVEFAARPKAAAPSALPPPSSPAAPLKPSAPVNGNRVSSASPITPDMEAMADRMNGGPDAPTKGNGTYKPGSNAATTSSLNDDLARLRRTYGAERISNLVRPDAPEVANGAITRATGAPSAMPDIAQQALLRDLQSGQLANPSRTLRALSQLVKEYQRNTGPAKSSVAQELADMLKKHGFNTGSE